MTEPIECRHVEWRNRYIWPVCFGADVSDEDARHAAARRLGCAPEDIELLRHNIVLCRYNPKQEDTNEIR